MQLIGVILSNWNNIKHNNDSNTFRTTASFYTKIKTPDDSKSNFKGAVLDTCKNKNA